MESPVRRPVSAVLVAVGVAEHDLLEVVPGDQLRRVRRLGEEMAHHLGRAVEVIDRLEERRDVDHTAGLTVLHGPEADFAQEYQDLEQVAHIVGHADDVGAHRLRRIPRRDGNDLEGVEELPRARRQLRAAGKQRTGGSQLVSEQLEPSRFVEGRVVGRDTGDPQHLGDGRFVNTAVLPDVERGEMKAERPSANERIGEQAARRDLFETCVRAACCRMRRSSMNRSAVYAGSPRRACMWRILTRKGSCWRWCATSASIGRSR